MVGLDAAVARADAGRWWGVVVTSPVGALVVAPGGRLAMAYGSEVTVLAEEDG